MSGPKVITIDSTIARRRTVAASHLRRLEEEIARWEKGVRALDEQGATATARARLDALREMLRTDRFAMIPAEAADEIAFLKNDLQVREARVIERAVAAREQERLHRESAALLLKTLAQKGIEPALAQSLRALANGDSAANAQETLARALRLLGAGAAETQPVLDEAQHELAQRLKSETPALSLAQWRARQTPRDERLARIDRQIAELRVRAGEPVARSFSAQLKQAEETVEARRRDMLLDALALELAQCARARKQWREQIESLQAAFADLTRKKAAPALRERIAQALFASESTPESTPNPAQISALQALAEEARAAARAAEEIENAQAIRRAMLEGLASLGYAVREGMDTLWAEDGKLVVSNASRPDQGMELLGRSAEKMQLRPVAFSARHDSRRDRDIETLFCRDVENLQALLQKEGMALTVAQARKIGETPVKVIASGENRREQRESRPRSRAR
jgi:N-dimethylarginine dimethylaminohydrolase